MGKDSKKSAVSKFINSKGAYVVLTFGVIAVAIITFVSVQNRLISRFDIEGQPSETYTYNFNLNDETTKKAAENKVTTVPADKPANVTTAKPVTVSYSLPLQGDIISPYSNGELVESKSMKDLRTHNGIDIAADVGAQVKAAADGIVSKVYQDDLWGWCVEITHADGKTSFYANLSDKVIAKEGQDVVKGDVIASVAKTAGIEYVEASHLHFEIRSDNAWVDPMSLIK